MADERQISEYGEFLKHLRIDKREMLKNMADKLGIKSSYLSAIESGNRDIPPNLTELICSKYGLSDEECKKLHEAELNEDRKLVQIDMEKINANRLAKEVGGIFCEKYKKRSSPECLYLFYFFPSKLDFLRFFMYNVK